MNGFIPYRSNSILKGDMKCLTEKKKALWEISFASDEDIPGWMELVRLVIDGFPHLNEEEYIPGLKTENQHRAGAYHEGQRLCHRHHAVFL